MKHKFVILIVTALVLTSGTIVYAACSCTKTTDIEASCSAQIYTGCLSGTCEVTGNLCPPVIEFSCGIIGHKCLVSYEVVRSHEKCDQSAPSLECYLDGDYNIEVWEDGDCGFLGFGCSAPSENEDKRRTKDDYNTRPCGT